LKDEYENKLKEAELKYEELLNEITSLKKSNLSCYDERLVETATVEFYRKVVLGLESEIKELRSENEFFKVKNAELESLMKRNTQESSFMKELIQELGVASEKDLYKKVLFLAEVAKQSKEIRQFVQKVSTIITKKSGKKDLNLKEITNYIQNKLT
jgi:reverse gyrase